MGVTLHDEPDRAAFARRSLADLVRRATGATFDHKYFAVGTAVWDGPEI